MGEHVSETFNGAEFGELGRWRDIRFQRVKLANVYVIRYPNRTKSSRAFMWRGNKSHRSSHADTVQATEQVFVLHKLMVPNIPPQMIAQSSICLCYQSSVGPSPELALPTAPSYSNPIYSVLFFPSSTISSASTSSLTLANGVICCTGRIASMKFSSTFPHISVATGPGLIAFTVASSANSLLHTRVMASNAAFVPLYTV